MDVNPSFINDGDYVMAKNVRIGFSEEDNMGCVENIKGTLEIKNDNLLENNRWKVVGAATYEAGSRLYQFRKDTAGSQDYIEEFNLITRTFTKVISGNLNLPDKIPTAVYFNDMLIWNYKDNGLKQISVSLAKAGYAYDQPFTDTLIKFPPDRAVTFETHISDPVVNSQVLGPNQYQFIYRFVFVNNQKSVWSVASIGCVIPNDTYDYIDLTLPATQIQLCDLYSGFIKYIEIGVRDDTTQPYQYFKRIDFPTVRTAALKVRFYNDIQYAAIADVETDLPYSDIPVRVNDFGIIDNRVFTAANAYGFGQVLISTLIFQRNTIPLVDNKYYLLQGGKYYVGVVLYDAYDRRSFVYQLGVFINPTRNGTFSPNEILLAVGGELPEWAVNWRLVVSNCSNVGDFIHAHIDFVVASSTELRFSPTFILPTPAGYAWAFTTGDRISILTSNGAGDPTGIPIAQNISLDYDTENAQYVVKGDFTGVANGALVQIFSPIKEASAQFYYEVGVTYPVIVVNGKRRFGDDYSGSNKLVHLDWGDTVWSSTQDAQIRNIDPVKYDTWFRNNGRPNVVSQDVQEEVFNGSEIAFSDPYVQGTKINGFNSFQPGSKQVYGIEFGIIQKITTARDFQINGSVLLVTTEYNNYSVYVGKSEIKTTNGTAILSTTDRLLGSANLLAGGYGTINPESVHVFGTTVRGWDALKGVFWRYSQDGLTPLSVEYGANAYARKLAERISDTREDPKQTAISCYDPYFDEWLICVRDASLELNETFAFNESKNGFSGFYSFDPDWMSTLNSSVISWKNGVLYLHRSSEEYNTLQGDRVKSSVTFVAKRNAFDTINDQALRLYAQDKWTVSINSIKTTVKQRQKTAMGLGFAELEEDYYDYPVTSDQYDSPMKSRHFIIEVTLDEIISRISVLYGAQIISSISPQSPTKS